MPFFVVMKRHFYILKANSAFRVPSQTLQPPSSQQKRCSAYMPLAHWFPSWGPKPISLVLSRSPCLNLQRPSKTFIHPPRMTMTDLSTKQSICFPLSLLLLLPVSRFLFSLSPLRRVSMCRIWWKSESADGSDTAARESNNAIPFWPWRTANSHVHQSIFLTRNLSFLRKPTDPSCKQRAIILRYFGPVDLWQSGRFCSGTLRRTKAEALHSLRCNWTCLASGSAASSRPSPRGDVSIGEKLFNPSCNCSEQAAGLFVSAKRSPFVTSGEQQEGFCSVVQRKCWH